MKLSLRRLFPLTSRRGSALHAATSTRLLVCMGGGGGEGQVDSAGMA